MFKRKRQLAVLEGKAALDALDDDLDWYLKRQEAIVMWGFRLQGFIAGAALSAAVTWLILRA
ncbi:hypothetical protein [Neorhizobium sp. P12A]|uniref:hypothetical protein n=1 Tax=Neorhizobium sp. P12A TaxID=2268027 RepID=UPI0011F06893|nr:hypothetical protein [Neorhizobium sp. P12A]